MNLPTAALVHLLALGTWLGCVLVEAVLEVTAWREPAAHPVVIRRGCTGRTWPRWCRAWSRRPLEPGARWIHLAFLAGVPAGLGALALGLR